MGAAGGVANGQGGEEEDDPLDAFMTDLKAPAVAQVSALIVTMSKRETVKMRWKQTNRGGGMRECNDQPQRPTGC